MIGYFSKNVNFSVLFSNYVNLSRFQFWPNLRSFWRKFFFTQNHSCVNFLTFGRSAVEPGTCHNFTESSSTYSRLYSCLKVDKIHRIVWLSFSKRTHFSFKHIMNIIKTCSVNARTYVDHCLACWEDDDLLSSLP